MFVFTIIVNLLLSLPLLAQEGQEALIQANDKYVVVEAEGMGITKLDALNEAWNDAVRRGLGMFVMSKTEVTDDKLTEQIVALAKGRINSYEELGSENNGETWWVKIRANIERDLLEETARRSGKIVVALDPEELGHSARQRLARAANEEDKLEAKKQLVSLFFENHDLYGFYELSEVKKSIENDKLVIKSKLKLNKSFLNDFKSKFIELLDQISISKSLYNYRPEVIDLNNQLSKNHVVKQRPYLITGILEKCDGFRITLPISNSSFVAYCLDKSLENIFHKTVKSYIDKLGYDLYHSHAQISFNILNNSQVIAMEGKNVLISFIFMPDKSIEFRPYMDNAKAYRDEIEVISEFDIAQFDNMGENISNNIMLETSLTFNKSQN
jgi:hypothetical protein